MGRNISSPKPHNKRGCSDVPEFQISGTSLHIEASDRRGMQEQQSHKSHNSGNNAPASLEKRAELRVQLALSKKRLEEEEE